MIEGTNSRPRDDHGDASAVPRPIDAAPTVREVNGPLPTGYTLMDRYRLSGIIGQGGMGVVYRARDLRLERDVAVKLLHNVREPRDLERFRREMKALAALESPHVVALFDAGHDVAPFLVMRLMAARTLKQALKDDGPPTPRRAVSYAAQLLIGLEALHEHNLVHRDIKPSNIMIDERDWVTLLDLGIVLDPTAAGITSGQTLLGTPKFMSPEQRRDATVDTRSDLYSVGLVLLETMCGGLPRLAFSTMPRIPFCSFLEGAAPELHGVLEKALACDPGRRWQSAPAMREALVAALEATDREVADTPYRSGGDDGPRAAIRRNAGRAAGKRARGGDKTQTTRALPKARNHAGLAVAPAPRRLPWWIATLLVAAAAIITVLGLASP